MILSFVQTISERGCGWFVDNPEDFQPGNGACVFGGLTLAVREISGHGNDGFLNRRTEIGFRVLFEFAQDHGGDLLRCMLLFINAHFMICAHVTLDRRNCAIRIADGLPFGDCPYQ